MKNITVEWVAMKYLIFLFSIVLVACNGQQTVGISNTEPEPIICSCDEEIIEIVNLKSDLGIAWEVIERLVIIRGLNQESKKLKQPTHAKKRLKK